VSKPVGSIALSPDGRRLAVMRVGTTFPVDLHGVDAKTGQRSPIQKQVSLPNELRVYDLQTGQAAPQAFRIPESDRPPPAQVDGLLFSPDGRRLLVRTARPIIYTAGQYELQPAYLLDAEVLQPTVTPLRIARTSGVGPQTTQALSSLRSDESLAAFSPDGRLVAFADGGNRAGVFETATGRALSPVPSHPGRVLWISFSPDGRRLATTGSEGMARLWDTTTGAPLGPAMPHPGVTRVGFNPDGTFLVTTGDSGLMFGSGTGLVRVWDGENGTPLTKGFDMQRGVESLVLGPDPRRVVLGLKDQAMVLTWEMPVTWDVPVEERPVDACEALSIVLSGHLIDSGEGLSLAPPERVEAARAALVRRQPAYFADPASQLPIPPPAGPPRP
jgi:WD40 repeat protein